MWRSSTTLLLSDCILVYSMHQSVARLNSLNHTVDFMCAITSGVVRFQSGQSAHDQLGSAQICSEPLDILQQNFAAFRSWNIDILLGFARLVSMVMLICSRIRR